MMRTSTFRQFLVLSLMAFAASVSAQTTTPLPSPVPPRMEPLEEMTEAPTTIVTPRADNGPTVTERREQGRVTEVKVTSGGSTYYLRPNTPAGSSVPGDITGSANRGPQWTLFEFDLGGSKKQPADPDAINNVPAPPTR
jgi:hypothetical protein